VLAFIRYCDYQSCMVYGIQTACREGGRILPNSRAIVLHQGGQCRWAREMIGWLIRAQKLISKRISCKGQGARHLVILVSRCVLECKSSVCVLCGSPVWPSPPVVGPLWGSPLCVGPLCGSLVGVLCVGPLCGSPLCGSPVWVPRRAAPLWHLLA